jgi:hypothetical protein
VLFLSLFLLPFTACYYQDCGEVSENVSNIHPSEKLLVMIDHMMDPCHFIFIYFPLLFNRIAEKDEVP